MKRKQGLLKVKREFLFLTLVLVIIFVVIPLVISISYGNIPFYNDNDLDSYDILVTNNKQMNNSEISFINYNTYTWEEIKQYVVRNKMSFSHVFRDVVVLVGTAILAILADRSFGRKSKSWKRK